MKCWRNDNELDYGTWEKNLNTKSYTLIKCNLELTQETKLYKQHISEN